MRKINVRVIPRAKQNKITTDDDGRLRVHITAAPVDGAVDAKQDKLTCVQGLDSAEHTDSNGLIWNFGN